VFKTENKEISTVLYAVWTWMQIKGEFNV